MSVDSRTKGRLMVLFEKVMQRGNSKVRAEYPAARHQNAPAILEQLEPRMMLSAAPVVTDAIDDMALAANAHTTINLFDAFDDDETVFTFNSNMGNFRVLMYESDCPITVENFRQYSQAGIYDNTIIHRSMPGFVIQGGGFNYEEDGTFWNLAQTTDLFDPIQNEYLHSNIAGTIAMAKVGSDPNSATSQWFFNLADNSSNLNNQNGGFTVFGEVLGTGMADVILPMAAVARYNAGSPLDNLPLNNYNNTLTELTDNNYLVFSNIYETSMQFSITNISNANLVSAQIDPITGELTVTSKGNFIGQSNITVTATDREGKTVSDTFTVAVTSANSNTGGKVVFTESDGDVVTISYAGKSAGKMTVDIADDISSIESILLNGSTVQDSVTISVKKAATGDGKIVIGGVTITGSLNAFTASTSNLTGDFTVTGVANKIQLANVTGSLITINSSLGTPGVVAPKGVTFLFESVVNSSIKTNGVGISKLDALNWAGGEGTNDNISAGWIGSVNIKGRTANVVKGITGYEGNFVGDITVSNADAKFVALNALVVAGGFIGDITAVNGLVSSVTVGEWNGLLQVKTLGKFYTKLSKTNPAIDGHVAGEFTILGTAATFVAANDINIAGAADGLRITANSGLINKITVANWDGGSITTMALNSLATKAVRGSNTLLGNLGIDITLDPAGYAGKPLRSTLGSVSVAGSLVDNTNRMAAWNVTGPVGAITVKGSADRQNFNFKGTLAGLTVSGIMRNSIVYAQTEIKSITLGAAFASDFLCGVVFLDHGITPLLTNFSTVGAIGTFNIKGYAVAKCAAIPDFFGDIYVYASSIKAATLTNGPATLDSRIFVPTTRDNIAKLTVTDTRTKITTIWQKGKTLPAIWQDEDDCPILVITA